MSYIETPAGHRFPWYVRLIFALQRRRYGRELEPARLWGRVPQAFLTMTLMYHALDRSGSSIEPALRALVQVRVAQINWCAYCVDLNSALALKRGVSDEKVAAVPECASSPLFSERERAALAYAEAVTRSERGEAAMIERLRAHFDDEAIIELTALVAYFNMSSKFNAVLGVAPLGFCRATAQHGPTSYKEDMPWDRARP